MGMSFSWRHLPIEGLRGRGRRMLDVLLAGSTAILAATGCAAPPTNSSFAGNGREAGGATAGLDGGYLPDAAFHLILDASALSEAALSSYSAFPSAPVGQGGVTPAEAATLATAFGHAPSGNGAGPCLTEPTLDAMFPTNFTPPLFEWSADPTLGIFELRLHVDNQESDLVVYTDKTNYTMDAKMWAALASESSGMDIAVTLRGGTLTSGLLSGKVLTGSTGIVHIAPVAAPGTVVYWTTSGTSALKGFKVGDTTVTTVLTPGSVQAASPAGDATTCIGCHVSSPDGNLVIFDRQEVAYGPFGIDARVLDGTSKEPSPSVVSTEALTALMMTYDVLPTLSPAHYSATDAVVLSLRNDVDPDADAGDNYELVWTDLHSGATGTMSRTGDPGQPDCPNFSRDGTKVAYASTTNGPIGIYGSPEVTDIDTIPYSSRQGGAATPLPGASDPAYNEYYPAYSPGDILLAFNRIPSGQSTYNSPSAEIFLVPAEGGQPARISANDPPSCSGVTSPGITNSWPKWAPESTTVGSKNYYWMVFSSTRRSNPAAATAVPQLFMSAVVTDTSGGTETLDKAYPAIYVTTQPADEANHTPAWDQFKIPPPPPPP